MGASGEQLARTALAQFPDAEAPIEIVPLVRSEDDIDEVLDRAAADGGLVIHTLVDADLRDCLVTGAAARGVSEIDVMGPVLDRMSCRLHRQPLGAPGLYRKLREDYFRRVEAIDFAVGHDDGRRSDELELADIVLIGPSRVGKTPLSMYLAMRGFKTANVPLVKGIDPPEGIFEVERSRVIGLSIEQDRLLAHRRHRQPHLGSAASTSYSDPREIYRDLEYAREIFRKGRFMTLDVSDKPIEESANEVVSLVSRRSSRR
jgi:hypothetical protein